MSSVTASTIFQQLPDELLVKILSGISIGDFACSSPVLRERVTRLSNYFPFKMTVEHEYLPSLRNYKLSFTSHMLSEEIAVFLLGEQYDITLHTAIEFLMQYLLVQAAGQKALQHPLVTVEIHKRPGWRAWLDSGSVPSHVIREQIEPIFSELADQIENDLIDTGDIGVSLDLFEAAIANFIEAVVTDEVHLLTQDSILNTDRMIAALTADLTVDLTADLTIDLTGDLPALPSAWRSTVIIAPPNNSVARVH